MRKIEGQDFNEIDSIDFSWIENMLVNRRGYSVAKAERCIYLYRCILKIAAMHPDMAIAPPTGADIAMHLHVMHTRKYYVDCQRIFGEYVHHDPEVAGTPEFWDAWRFTVDKLKEYFGISVPNDSIFQASELEPELCALLARV